MTIGVELHSWYRLVASAFFDPTKRKAGDSKAVVHSAAYRIHDHKSITFRAAPPAGNRIVPGKLHVRLGSFTYACPKPTELLRDDRRRRLTMIDVLNSIVAEPGPRRTFVQIDFAVSSLSFLDKSSVLPAITDPNVSFRTTISHPPIRVGKVND